MADHLSGSAAAHDHATSHSPRSTLQLIPERLNYSAVMQVPAEEQADLDDAVADILDAYRLFADTLTETQRERLHFPLDGMERTAGRDTSATPSFCAVLVWCRPAWGLQLGNLTFAQRMACETLLLASLGPTGYELASGARNRQQMIGVLEDPASTQAIEMGRKVFPDRSFTDIWELIAALQANGTVLSPEAIRAAAVGGLDPTWDDWLWPPPGLVQRWNQFEDYSIAIFGEPDDEIWALRFEGHHVSHNLTFVKVDEHWQVHGTPLFVGAFPVVVPPPLTKDDLSNPLLWQQGQSSGLGLIRSARKFWSALPERERSAALRPAESFPQQAPLLNTEPGGPMIVTMELEPDAGVIAQGPHVDMSAASLSADARRPLAALCNELLSHLHPAVAAAYRGRLYEAVHSGTILATWAGGDLRDPGSPHFTSVAVGPFVVELLQTPGYSVTSPELPWSNHLHVMLRDVASPMWGSPLSDHQHNDHVH